MSTETSALTPITDQHAYQHSPRSEGPCFWGTCKQQRGAALAKGIARTAVVKGPIALKYLKEQRSRLPKAHLLVFGIRDDLYGFLR